MWPISRKNLPKQFLKMREFGRVSLYQQALKRALVVSKPQNIIIVTLKEYKYHCRNQAIEVWCEIPEKQILVELEWKNTLPAITYWMSELENEDVALIFPSDHTIDDNDLFKTAVDIALPKTETSLITFWIKPTNPNTWYGYIATKGCKIPPFNVQDFKEKPDLDTAETYIKNWYYWNSWIFLFQKSMYFKELKKASPNIHHLFTSEDDIEEIYSKVVADSIDYWLLEKSSNISLMPLDIYWSDLWSFDALAQYVKRKEYISSHTHNIDSDNYLTVSNVKNKEYYFIWMEDFIVVDTHDALLISKKWHSEKVKKLVWSLSEQSSKVIEFWRTVYRPWGSYKIIDEWNGFIIKRLTVQPWKKISYQLHYHRSEHWVVVEWTWVVTLEEKQVILKKWETIYIPTGTKHRLENLGKVNLEIIESQIWEYLEDDDIIRFDDEYWRV